MLDVRSAALLAGDSPGHPLGDGEALFLIASVANLRRAGVLLIRQINHSYSVTTNLSAGLLGHPLHHVAALLPGDGAALLSGDVLTLLLIDIPSPCHGLVFANLVRNLLALLARLLDIIAGLKETNMKTS